ncbi:MAG TPA: F0F1 ATP synthase subunit A [Gemmatimonadales bacterium]|jgi:F-type H+-transporting ATPase subunit a|nr:F0F1 ATP synthase subunit A [Gemmatimonadales bacterium]
MMTQTQGPDFNIGEMIFHHTGDAHELDFAPFGTINLPRFTPFHVGPLTVDLSPTKHVVFVLLAATIVFTMMKVAASGVARAQRAGKAPGGFAGAIEATVLWVRNDIAIESIGKEMGPVYAPLIICLFFFILVCNLLGLLPFGAVPTGNLAVTGALALIAFVAIEIGGMIKLGFKGYMGTIFPKIHGLPPAGAIAMSIFMAPIELISKLVKPFAFMIRLFGNMTAGHFVILTMFGIVFMFGRLGAVSYGLGILTALVVLGVMMLELLVAVLQAYVFALLASVFIGMMQHEH